MTESHEEVRLFAVAEWPSPEPREYDEAVAAIDAAYEGVTKRLANLRTARDSINGEIRQLVAEQRRLERMRRVGKEPDVQEEAT